MTGSSHTIYRERLGAAAEQAQDSMAKAWLFVFGCFHRREGQEGGPATAPDDPERSSDEIRASTSIR